MKKFMTVALATAMTAALACTAFAGQGTVDYGTFGQSDEWGSFINPGASVSDITTITSVDIVCTGFDDLPNGCYEVSSADDGWAWDAVTLSEDNYTANADGSFTVHIPVTFTSACENFAKVQIQSWVDGETVTISNVVFNTASSDTADVAPIAYLAAIVAVAGVAMVASKKRA
ncbi:MAG: hypothetical protein K6F92_10505 [Lachnospiraceae bacterium]|nr:hypothetical protein [Lachnospiraceae bacterium]